MKNISPDVRRLTTLALLAAVAVVLVAILHFPLLPAAPFLEYDPADIPILIGTFLFGPAAGLALTVAASVLQGLTVSSSSGVIGIVMHIFATGSFALVAGNVYKKRRTRKAAVLALVLGTLTMTAAMCVWNLVFTPIFMGQPVKDIIGMLLPVFIPFNLIKASVNSVVTFFVYKPISRAIFGEKSTQTA